MAPDAPTSRRRRPVTPAMSRTKPIDEQTCTACHNETSPHYKPFFYSAMKGLVHRQG